MLPPSSRELAARLRRLTRECRAHPILKQATALSRARSLALYVVGGAVRDALLGQAPRADYDLLVPRGALELARALADAAGGSFVPLDLERGIARVVTRGKDGPAGVYDVSDWQRPTLEEDLCARDFTINALALDLEGARVLDPSGGLDDLRRGVIRAPSAAVLDEDPLRMLRAFRFVAGLGFALDEATAAAIPARAHLVRRMAGERVRDELFKILAVEGCFPVVARMADCGLLAAILPEVEALRGMQQGAFHHLDVYGHSMLTLDMLEAAALPAALSPFDRRHGHLVQETAGGRSRRELLKLGALLHDVGKAVSREVDAQSGRIHYPGHERSGAEMVDAVAERLRLARVEQKLLHGVVRWHLRPLDMPAPAALTGGEIRRYFRETGGAGPDTLVLALADSAASRGPANTPEVQQALRQRVGMMLDWYFDGERLAARPLLDGHDVARLTNAPPGPEVGRLLEALQDAQADGRVRTREEAEAFVRESQPGSVADGTATPSS